MGLQTDSPGFSWGFCALLLGGQMSQVSTFRIYTCTQYCHAAVRRMIHGISIFFDPDVISGCSICLLAFDWCKFREYSYFFAGTWLLHWSIIPYTIGKIAPNCSKKLAIGGEPIGLSRTGARRCFLLSKLLLMLCLQCVLTKLQALLLLWPAELAFSILAKQGKLEIQSDLEFVFLLSFAVKP